MFFPPLRVPWPQIVNWGTSGKEAGGLCSPRPPLYFALHGKSCPEWGRGTSINIHFPNKSFSMVILESIYVCWDVSGQESKWCATWIRRRMAPSVIFWLTALGCWSVSTFTGAAYLLVGKLFPAKISFQLCIHGIWWSFKLYDLIVHCQGNLTL